MAQTTQGDERVGDRIADKYHLTRLLGSGGMGAVYEATHQFTQRRVAVKLMHPQFARSGVAAERFVRESQAPSSIGHPGIVEVLDGGYDNDGSLYLVLELLEGRTLSDDLEQGRMDPDALGHVMLELLDALEAAHAAGFVHRDIKPENIFLVGMDDEPRVKLLDFGVAGVLADDEDNPNLTKAGSVLGTPLYMSPEQAKGRSVDARSDLWSVGAVMYQALTGRPPFGGDNFQALVVSIVTQEHFPLETVRPDLPVRVTTVVERALEKEPQERWQDAGEMAAALPQALEARRRSATAAERPRAMRAERAAQVARIAAQPEPEPSRGLPLWFYGATVLAMGAIGGILWSASASGGEAVAEAVAEAEAVAGSETGTATETETETETGTGTGTETVAGSVAETETGTATATATATETVAGSVAETETGTAAGTAAEIVREAEAESTPIRAPARGLGGEELAQVLGAHQGEMQKCYESAMLELLLRRPNIEVAPLRVDVALDVSAAGRVRGVTLTGDMPAGMEACCRRKLLAWRFPSADQSTDLGFPVVFQPTVIRR